jgi:hypothetical protein
MEVLYCATISEDASGCEQLYVKARLCAFIGRSEILSPKGSSPATQMQNVRNNLGLGIKSRLGKSSEQIRSRHRVSLGQQQYLKMMWHILYHFCKFSCCTT